MDFSPLFTIIQEHIKTTGKCNNKFLIFFICMPSTFLSTRDIVYPICPFYFKWNMLKFLGKERLPLLSKNFGRSINLQSDTFITFIFCTYFHNTYYTLHSLYFPSIRYFPNTSEQFFQYLPQIAKTVPILILFSTY